MAGDNELPLFVSDDENDKNEQQSSTSLFNQPLSLLQQQQHQEEIDTPMIGGLLFQEEEQEHDQLIGITSLSYYQEDHHDSHETLFIDNEHDHEMMVMINEQEKENNHSRDLNAIYPPDANTSTVTTATAKSSTEVLSFNTNNIQSNSINKSKFKVNLAAASKRKIDVNSNIQSNNSTSAILTSSQSSLLNQQQQQTRTRNTMRMMMEQNMNASGPFALGPANAKGAVLVEQKTSITSIRKSNNGASDKSLSSNSNVNKSAELSDLDTRKRDPSLAPSDLSSSYLPIPDSQQNYLNPPTSDDEEDYEQFDDPDVLVPLTLKGKQMTASFSNNITNLNKMTYNKMDTDSMIEGENIKVKHEHSTKLFQTDVSNLFFFQFPPYFKDSIAKATAIQNEDDMDIKEEEENEGECNFSHKDRNDHKNESAKITPSKEGWIGEMFVDDFGQSKLRIGEHLFDINPVPLSRDVQLAYVDETRKNLVLTGAVSKTKFLCTPDLDNFLMNSQC